MKRLSILVHSPYENKITPQRIMNACNAYKSC